MYLWINQHGIVQTKPFPLFAFMCVCHPSIVFSLPATHYLFCSFHADPFCPHVPIVHAACSHLGWDFLQTCPLCLGNEPTALHRSFIFPCVLDMTDEWGPPELCSLGLQIKATPTSRQSINQFTPRAPDQPINQSVSQQMLLSLRVGAGSGMVELVPPTQAERSQVSGSVCTFSHQFLLVHFRLEIKESYIWSESSAWICVLIKMSCVWQSSLPPVSPTSRPAG